MAEKKQELKNISKREKYREKWHDYNLQSRRFDEPVSTIDLTTLPLLKRPRSRLDVEVPSRHGATGPGTSCASTNDAKDKPTDRSSRPSTSSSTGQQTDIGNTGMMTSELGNDSSDRSDFAQGESVLLDVLEAYTHMVLEGDCISPCNEHFTQFIVNEFDQGSHSIKHGKYVMVTRKSMCFRGRWEWAYFCSCNPARSQVLRSASVHVQQRMEDMLLGFPDCLHIKCLAKVLVDFDEASGISADHQSQDHNYSVGLVEDFDIPCHHNDIWPVCGNPHAAVIVTDQAFAIVHASSGVLKCFSCGTGECHHTLQLKSTLQQQDAELPEFLINISSKLQSSTDKRIRPLPCVDSWKKIPFSLENHEELQEALKKPVEQRVFSGDDGVLKLIPSQDGLCDSCGSVWGDEICLKGSYPVFSLQRVYHASVFSRKCSNKSCNCRLMYDGLKDCLLNMSTYLLDHSVLRQYMHQFLYGRSPMYGFYTVWVEMQSDVGNNTFSSALHYNKFLWAWYGFLHLLDIDYQQQFVCMSCGSNPDVVICDATHLAIRKDLSFWKETVLQTTKSSLKSSTRQSIFIPDGQTRDLLKKYSKCTETHTLSAVDFLTLVTGCKQHQPSLVPLLTKFGETGSVCFPPSGYKPLLKALSAASPVCGLIHPEEDLLEVLLKIAAGFSPRRDLAAMAILTDKCPLIADLIESEGDLGAVLFPIFQELVRLTLAPFEQSSSSGSSDSAQPSFTLDHTVDDFIESGFWPHLPKQRAREDYTMDGRKSTKTSCRKDSKNYGRMTPGIFAAFCPHGICYGFEMMKQFESPNVPFTLFLTRFVTPPKVVIYDNACHLHTYCLNREPELFKNTKFLIDRLHWPNHTACSIGYKLDGYLRYKTLNSQVAEQMNSSLKRIKVQLSYMRHDNFWWHCRFFLWARNLKKQSRLFSTP